MVMFLKFAVCSFSKGVTREEFEHLFGSIVRNRLGFRPEEGSKPEKMKPQLQEKQMSLVLDAAQACLRLRLGFRFGFRKVRISYSGVTR